MIRINGVCAEAGDVIVTHKWIFEHPSILLPGQLVFTNTPTRGEHIAPLESVVRNGVIRVIKTPRFYAGIVVANAYRMAQTPQQYDLFSNNCEHTVARAFGRPPSSPQLEAWGKFVGLVGVAVILSRLS
jgi:hypothetical protein